MTDSEGNTTSKVWKDGEDATVQMEKELATETRKVEEKEARFK